jgi:PAS domain S-box-containing protein
MQIDNRPTSNSLLAAIVESSDDAIISKNLEGIVSSWNPAAARIFGYSAEEMIGQSILKLIPPELHHEEDMILSRIRSGRKIDHYETTRVQKDGTKIQVAVTISPVKDEAGQIVGASKVARDITDRRRKDDSRALLASIVDSSDDAIVSKDLNGKVTSWNRGAGQLFGYSAEEMVGASILRLIPRDLYPEEEMILSKIRAGERIDHYETTRQRKDGKLIEVSVTISPIRDRDGRIIGASKIARDVSERKKVERLLVQSEKIAATGRMAATVAHEINNPLESVMNLIYLARRNSPQGGKAFGYLQTAEAELERVSHIARQTLGYYRETGSPKLLALHELANDVLTLYAGKLQAQGITVRCDFRSQRQITANKGEILQVLSNVIANAIDAMNHGGVLAVTVDDTSESQRGGVELTVRDNGSGIPDEHKERIFEPFFTTKGNLGTGIGLWVSKQIVDQHGGRIAISSETKGKDKGTAVKVFLPLHFL